MEPDGSTLLAAEIQRVEGISQCFSRRTEECLNPVSQLSGGQIKALYTGGKVGTGVWLGSE